MQKIFLLVIPALLCFFTNCKKDNNDFPGTPGNPQITSLQVPEQAFFGDSISFSANVSDPLVPLSTLKAQLFFGEDMVSQTTIRTKADGHYAGKVFVPFLKNIPNGKATLKLVLQDIHFTKKEEEHQVTLSRPQYSYLYLVTENGDSLKMLRSEENTYLFRTATSAPQIIKGYIVAPAFGNNGNNINFGWGGGTIKENIKNPITFLSLQSSPYNILFNTFTYERSPFASYKLNDKEMNFTADGHFFIDLNLNTGDELKAEGVQDFDQYWIDPDFLKKDASGKITFSAISGKYRIVADRDKKYLNVLTLNASGEKATLQPDGSGAIWIAGWGIAKPGMNNGQPGWSPGKMLCMAPVKPKVYQMTITASTEKGNGQIRTDYFDFKFFFQDGWGGEYRGPDYAETKGIIPEIVTVQESGNLGLSSGKQLTEGKVYIISIDCTEGRAKPKLEIKEKI